MAASKATIRRAAEKGLPSLPDLIHGSASPDCDTCEGDGLVCEDHPDRAWGGCGVLCGAPGMPCACTGLGDAR